MNAVGKIHGLLKKPEQFNLAQVEVLNPTVLGQRPCSLRVASVGPWATPQAGCKVSYLWL